MKPRGFMLLEVVVAIGILVVGMAFVGMQIQNAAITSRRAERSMRALLLARMKLAELDAGMLLVDAEETEEEFGPLFPDYGWRLRVEPTAVVDLNLLVLEILYQARPDVEEPFDFEEAETVQTLFTMRATPVVLDLTRDFGMSEEEADDLTEQLSDIGADGLDPRNLDPSIFANLDMEELLQAAPSLLEAFGIRIEDLLGTLPDDLRQALEEAQQQQGDGASDEDGDAASPSSDQSDRGGRKPRDPRTRN